MSESHAGGCYCGAVRYAFDGEPLDAVLCHCANCRRAVGAQAVAWVIVPRANFRYTAGAPARYQTDTGAWRAFCGRCGSSLTYESPKRPDHVDLTTGSLDQPARFPPKWDSFTDERLAWVPLAK